MSVGVKFPLDSLPSSLCQVRVDLPGKETQIVFEKILRNLARTAPPVPGFRREKGGNYFFCIFNLHILTRKSNFFCNIKS